jgi:guanosine-3',5'-bis(diphosphate) 3'-pyrophosphohydrolase
MIEEVECARQMAIKAHGEQKYDSKPFVVHLDHVVHILQKNLVNPGQDLILAAYLHDTLEDTALTKAEIKAEFGDEVADIVWRVTDEPGDTRKASKAATYPKIKGHYAATVLKLCDRIANVEAALAVPKYAAMYKNEHADFKAGIYVEGMAEDLWCMLGALIEQL